MSRCKQLYIQRINSKVLLQSKGNCVQYPMINYNERENEKNIRIRIATTLLYTRKHHNTVNQLYCNKNKTNK